jgi:hypothetical protein
METCCRCPAAGAPQALHKATVMPKLLSSRRAYLFCRIMTIDCHQAHHRNLLTVNCTDGLSTGSISNTATVNIDTCSHTNVTLRNWMHEIGIMPVACARPLFPVLL